MKELTPHLWIRFGDHGDLTHQVDWNHESDEFPLLCKFSEDAFYTYHSFRPMANGDRYIAYSEYEKVVAELEALKHVELIEEYADFMKKRE